MRIGALTAYLLTLGALALLNNALELAALMVGLALMAHATVPTRSR